MDGSGQRNNVTLLVGIGLVLVGLLAGILVMLFVVDLKAPPASSQPVVERVQLGDPDPARPSVETAEELASSAAEPLLLNRLFRQVADLVTPAVVYIQVESDRGVPRDWFHDFDEDARRRFFRENPSRQSVGSGVIVSPDGYVVTNYHVVEDATDIQVTLQDKRLYAARVVGVDPSTDLAVLQLKAASDLPLIRFGDSDKVTVGEWVLAVGNPFRLTSTVTAGIVSALGRQVGIIEDDMRVEDFIQTDAAINPGNSGGALVNLRGELVGISTAIATESGSYEGYGFAVPVNLVERVAEDLIEHGRVRRGFLGVTIQEIDAHAARQLGLERVRGVYVNRVQDGGAASQAGLKGGDVVLSIDGMEVNAPNELQSTVARHRPGDRLAVQVWRRGVAEAFEIELLGGDDPAYTEWFAELGRQDAPDMTPELLPDHPDVGVFDVDAWGLGLREVTRRERAAFEVESGAYVAYVENGGPAAAGGLPRDVILLEVDGTEVTSAENARRLLGEAAGRDEAALFRVKGRNGLSSFYELDVPQQ